MFGQCPYINDVVKPCTSYVKGGFCSRPDLFRCLEYIKVHEPAISFSAIKDFTQCHRKYWYAWGQGIELIEKSRALRLGSMADQILSCLHDSRNVGLNPTPEEQYTKMINAEIEKTIDPEDSDSVGDLDLWKMKALFDGYIELDRHTLKGITQHEFRWNEVEYPKLHGYIDLTLREDKFGDEFKYTNNPDWYSERWNMNDQLSAYFIGMPDLEQFRVICLVPPALKMKKNETITKFYARMREDVIQRSITAYFITTTFWRSEFDLEAYKRKAKMVSEEIMHYIVQDPIKLADPFYQNLSACYSPYECDFIHICRSGVMPENLYKKRLPR